MAIRILDFLKKEWVLVVLLLLLGLGTRFYAFGYPDRIVFDELYFANFVSHYYLHSFYFDIHPPLAKLIMAGVSKLFGANPILTFGYTSINDVYPDSFYELLRGIVSFFGALFPLGIYALSRSLRLSKITSFLAGLFVIFDNAVLVQSRFILTDIFLLTFGTFGLAAIVHAVRNARIRYWLLFAGSLLVGCAYSVKWTGLLFLGLSFVAILFHLIRTRSWKRFIAGFSVILFSSLALYSIINIIHVQDLYKTGPGDPFMSIGFQSTLAGNPNYGLTDLPPNVIQKTIELQERMYTANAGITASHPYGSKWYTWPFLERTVYYWDNKTSDSAEARIYLLGNPVIWWGGLAAIIILCVFLVSRLVRGAYADAAVPGFLLIGYFANLVAYIPISRVSFLYHYFPSFVFLAIALAFVLEKLRVRWLTVGFVILAIGMFLYLSPLSYGFPLSSQAFEARMFLNSWK